MIGCMGKTGLITTLAVILKLDIEPTGALGALVVSKAQGGSCQLPVDLTLPMGYIYSESFHESERFSHAFKYVFLLDDLAITDTPGFLVE